MGVTLLTKLIKTITPTVSTFTSSYSRPAVVKECRIRSIRTECTNLSWEHERGNADRPIPALHISAMFGCQWLRSACTNRREWPGLIQNSSKDTKERISCLNHGCLMELILSHLWRNVAIRSTQPLLNVSPTRPPGDSLSPLLIFLKSHGDQNSLLGWTPDGFCVWKISLCSGSHSNLRVHNPDTTATVKETAACKCTAWVYGTSVLTGSQPEVWM